MQRTTAALTGLALLLAACGSDTADDLATADSQTATTAAADETTEASDGDAAASDDDAASDGDDTEDTATAGTVESYTIEVWADNWMAVYVDGVLVGEDSVPITTERSFNSETFTFDAATPFTLAIEAKDFKETDSGLEYIGESNQQMGDGGIIAQVTDSTGAVVAASNGDWRALVVHQAPLNTECESSDDPDAECQFTVLETPSDWTAADFDDSAWGAATVWTAADVDPKLGYDDISWDGAAELIWGSDLEVDNTVLLRTVVG